MAKQQSVQVMDDILYKAARVNGSDIPLEINFHSQTWDQNNALHVAAQYGNLGFITESRDQLQRLNGNYYRHLCHKNSKGETPLHVASQFGQLQIVKELMSMHSHAIESVDVNLKKNCWRERDNKGDTPAHKALINGHDDTAVALLGNDPHSSIIVLGSIVNNEGGSLAYLAAENMCYRFINIIFEGDYDLNDVSLSGYKGQTVFHSARRWPRDSLMPKLVNITNGHLMNKQDDRGKTVLHYAVEEMKYGMVKELLKADSSLACVRDNNGITPLHKAFEKGLFKAVKSIVQRSPQSIEVCDEHGKAPFHYTKMDVIFLEQCRTNMDLDILKLMINKVDKDGNTALHVALINSEPEAANELAQFNGCNRCLRNSDGYSPLDLCKSNDYRKFPVYHLLRCAEEGVQVKRPLGWRDWLELIGIAISLFGHVAGMEDEDLDKLLKKICLTASLLLPISFTTSYDLIGGYNSTTGVPILKDNPYFRGYNMSNMIIFFATIIILIISTLSVGKNANRKQLSASASIILLQVALLATVDAYGHAFNMTGVLNRRRWHSLPYLLFGSGNYIIGTLFPLNLRTGDIRTLKESYYRLRHSAI